MTIANRKFGVEIEFSGNRSEAKQFLSRNGIRFSGRNPWTMKYDVSIPRNGSELCSPPLKGEAGINELKKAVKLMSRWGNGHVNKSCGLHVHVDAAGLTPPEALNVVKRYHRFENDIDAFMPRSRRKNKNKYCYSLDKIASYEWHDMGEAQDLWDLGAAFLDRRRKVNLVSLEDHGTIEFRQHSGTLNYNKIENWVRFCVGFVEASRVGVEQRSRQTQATPQANNQTPLRGNLKRMAETLERSTTARSVVQLSNSVGCARASVPALISWLRRYGYDIKINRGKYKLISTPIQEIDLVEYIRRFRGFSASHVRIVEKLNDGNTPRIVHSIEEISDYAGVSENTVRSYLSNLRAAGFIITYDEGAVTLYKDETIQRVQERNNFGHQQSSRATYDYDTQVRQIPNDNWMRGIEQEVVLFLRERAMELV